METTSATVLPRPWTGGSALTRLDDKELAEAEAVAKEPLPDLPTCDSQTFGQMLRMMLAALPRRQSDDVSGELFVAAYERALGHLNRSQAEYLLDRSINECRWFPTIAECHGLLQGWRRNDEHTRRRAEAKRNVWAEREARRDEIGEAHRRLRRDLTQADIDAMPQPLKEIGISMGYLWDDNGTVKSTEMWPV